MSDLRRPMMSGHCAFPAANADSHEVCARGGGGNSRNPGKIFQPCACDCHLGETFECGGCGQEIREAPLWPLDEDGDMRYTHVDIRTGRATGEEC